MPSLAQSIAEEIARTGPMPFRRFMERALYDPAHGYYASGRAAIGGEGDFMTSVSVGPLFGRLLATQFEEIWERLDRPTRFDLVEQGANRGEFAHDVLSAAQSSPAFFAALHYLIIEPFAVNRERQEARLEPFAGKVTWHDALDALPRFTGVHFSNELVDAFPVHRVVYRNGKWWEQYVAQGANGSFVWSDGPISNPQLTPFFAHLPGIEGYQTEVNREAPVWMAALAAKLERGYVLVADYGFSRDDYYLPDRREGTLAAYRQHRVCENPLADPGGQDLTAHVDFTTLAQAAQTAGLKLAGFTDQHHFLVALGRSIFPDITSPGQLTPERQKQQRAFATLMHPTLMGRGFQFLALAKGVPAALRGFELAAEPHRSLGLEISPAPVEN
jgi:SAM-dependent MidA family methyltransferase